MYSAGKKQKCCATCANWGGPREVNPSGMSVVLERCEDRGECYANVSCIGKRGSQPFQGSNCSEYQLWGALK